MARAEAAWRAIPAFTSNDFDDQSPLFDRTRTCTVSFVVLPRAASSVCFDGRRDTLGQA
jgi:hypothetical protein